MKMTEVAKLSGDLNISLKRHFTSLFLRLHCHAALTCTCINSSHFVLHFAASSKGLLAMMWACTLTAHCLKPEMFSCCSSVCRFALKPCLSLGEWTWLLTHSFSHQYVYEAWRRPRLHVFGGPLVSKLLLAWLHLSWITCKRQRARAL